MKSRVFILLAVLAMPVHGTPAPASAEKVQRLFHKLQHFPVGATRAVKVARVLVALAKLDPKRAYKYCRIAVTRLDNADGTAAAVAAKLWHVVRIIKTGGPLSYPGDTRFTPPTPTPSPTP